MFIPVPSPERESQSTPHATANSSSEDTKKQAGQYLTAHHSDCSTVFFSYYFLTHVMICCFSLAVIGIKYSHWIFMIENDVNDMNIFINCLCAHWCNFRFDIRIIQVFKCIFFLSVFRQ